MARVRLTIDGKLELDGDLGTWERQPPELIRDLITPGAKPKPALKAAMLAISDAFLTGQSVDIDLKNESDSYTLTVKALVVNELPA